MSLTFSPACLRLLLTWSPCPWVSSASSSVVLPTPSLILPLISSALLSILSSVPMITPQVTKFLWGKGFLPAVPACAAATGAHHEAEQPHHEHDARDHPQ